MKTTNPSSRITISQNGNQILTCKVYKEPNYILSMSNEEILEFISGLDYMGNLPTVPDLEKPIEIQVSTIRQIPLEQNKEVQTKIKEIIYNNLYDTLIDELKGTISRFQAQYNIQEINPYLQDILQNPEDLVPHSQQRNIQITRYTINLPISYTPNLNIHISLTKIQILINI